MNIFFFHKRVYAIFFFVFLILILERLLWQCSWQQRNVKRKKWKQKPRLVDIPWYKVVRCGRNWQVRRFGAKISPAKYSTCFRGLMEHYIRFRWRMYRYLICNNLIDNKLHQHHIGYSRHKRLHYSDSQNFTT